MVDFDRGLRNRVRDLLAQCRQLQHKLVKLMDPDRDRLRFYYLGNHYQTKAEHFGTKACYEAEGVLIIECDRKAHSRFRGDLHRNDAVFAK